jgi:hypothetical protein
MKKLVISILPISLLTAALSFSGCAKQGEEAVSPTPTPTATPVVAATETPTPTPAATGDLTAAKDHLDKAATELKNNNNKGALDHVDLALDELKAALVNADAKTRVDLETAQKELDSARGLIEKNDKTAATSLAKVTAKVAKLASAPKSATSPAAAAPSAGKSETKPAEKRN